MLARCCTGIRFCSIIFVLLFASPAAAAQDVVLAGADRWTVAAVSFIRLLQAGEYERAAAVVPPELAAGPMSAAALETIWGQLDAQLGSLRDLRPLRSTEQGEQRLVELLASFEQQELVLLVPLDAGKRVLGFRLLPGGDVPYRVPAYADTTAFEERELTVGAAPWQLGATLSVPKGAGPFAAVVLVHGSGPNDRDETIGPNRPFRDLAWGLASAGIAVLRYEKRTRAHGHRLDPETLGLDDEVVDDALAALELLRALDEIDPGRISVLGHSLGATLAPVIAQRDGRTAGVIMLAAMARPFGKVLVEQLRYLEPLQARTAQDSAQFQVLFQRLAALNAGELPDSARILGMPVRYVRELDGLRVTQVARSGSFPLLVLQGERDYQVTMADFELWRNALAARSGATLRSYPALDHLFMAGTGPSSPEQYMTEQRNVDQAVVRDVIDWIRGVGRPGGEPRDWPAGPGQLGGGGRPGR